MKLILFIILSAQILFGRSVNISGELKVWHKITITFEGPNSSEHSMLNPFTSYRLDVDFTHDQISYTVPGYYAADGNAAETSGSSGNKWRVHFIPDRTGKWTFKVSFRTGYFVSISTSSIAGLPISPDGTNGSFFIGPSDKKAPDFRAKGMLKYVGERYLQFGGTKDFFLKGGSNSPENFLAYYEFDQTPDNHKFAAHHNDWNEGDPIWKGGKGKNIIGAINYLSSKGINSLYMLTFNVGGDGNDVWMYTSSNNRQRFDCSKLDQWEIVFSHMDKKGILCHFVTQETENEYTLNDGNLGSDRKLYYRELVARFGHHLGVNWNLGEENTNTTEQQKSYASYIRSIDPYNHMISIHSQNYSRFKSLYGFSNIDGPSLYVFNPEQTHTKTIQYINESAQHGRKWVVSVDEIGPADSSVATDAIDYWHDKNRKQVLWATLMAGGAGLEWYMGYAYPHNDLKMEDFRSRKHLWELTTLAIDFFKMNLPFNEMESANHLLTGSKNFCLAKNNDTYAIYLPNGGTTSITLNNASSYTVRWFNPRTGGSLVSGSINSISGRGTKPIGFPPTDIYNDWVVLVKKILTKESVDIKETEIMNYQLFTNYPNPFNASTTQKYSLPEVTHVNLKVYDILGNVVATLIDEQQTAGTYNITWESGEAATGVYVIRIETPKYTAVRKILLLK